MEDCQPPGTQSFLFLPFGSQVVADIMSSIQRLLLSLKEWIQEISLEIKKQKRLLLENNKRVFF
jgi:cell shape-determining protein MreC